MIRLIGINHLAARYKLGTTRSPGNIQFKDCVESAIRDSRPELLAQEDHKDFLLRGWAFILPEIGAHFRLDREVLNVDLNKPQRKQRGYKDEREMERIWAARRPDPWDRVVGQAHEIAHQFPIREEHWPKALKETGARNIIFVCGDLHVTTFTRLLDREGVLFSVLMRGIGVNSSNS